MSSHLQAERIGYGVANTIFSTAMFSGMNVLIKELGDNYHVAQLIFFRNFFALFPVLVLVYMAGGFKVIRTHNIRGHFGRALLGTFAMVLSFMSFILLPIADATALHFAAPIILTALSVPLLKEHVGIYRWTAVIFGFFGVIIIADPGHMHNFTGVAVALSAAFVMAFTMIIVRKLSKTENGVCIVFYFSVFGTALSATALPFVWTMPDPVDLLMLCSIGLVGGTAQYFMTIGYANAPAVVIGALNYMAIVFAAIWGYLVWDTIPEAHVVHGAAIVIFSGLIIVYREQVLRIGLTRTSLYSMYVSLRGRGLGIRPRKDR